MKRVFAVSIACIVVIISYLLLNDSSEEAINNPSSATATPQTEDNFEELNWEHYEFSEVGLSFSAPFEMEVTGEKSDESTFILYIQRSEYPEDEYYQLYGLYNLNGSEDVSREDLKTELNPESISETKISGFPTIQGQYKGERNRFVTFIITDRGVFNLATSQPTEQNRLLTDDILSTFVLE